MPNEKPLKKKMKKFTKSFKEKFNLKTIQIYSQGDLQSLKRKILFLN